MASSSSAASKAPAWTLVRAAASARPARCAGSSVSIRGPLQKCGRCGQPAACLRPPGRAFQLRGDVLIWPGRGLRPVPGPPVGIDPRIGDLRQRARAPPACPGPTLTGRPPSGPADGGTAPGCRTRPGRPRPRVRLRRRRCPARRPLATPAPGRQSGRPPPAGAAAGSGPGRACTRRRKLSSMLPARGTAPGSPNPPASWAGVNPRGSSSKASGLPRVSATI